MYNNWGITNNNQALGNQEDYSSQHGLNSQQQMLVEQGVQPYRASGYPVDANAIQNIANQAGASPGQVNSYLQQRYGSAPPAYHNPGQAYNVPQASHQDLVNSLGGEYLYRGDSRGPEQIFRPTAQGGGFQSRGSNMNLEQWVNNEQTHDSGYISTSRDYNSARESAFGNSDPEPAVGYVYTINGRIPGQHDVNAELGHHDSVSTEEQEVAIRRRISASDIHFATAVHNEDHGPVDGQSEFNPHWRVRRS